MAVVPVLFLVSLATFSLLELTPGDPALEIAGPEATPQVVEQIRSELGLDEPFVSRYLTWMGSTLRGEFGTSVRTHQPVSEAIKERLPVTLEVALFGLLGGILVSVPLALFCASHPDGIVDRATQLGTSFLISAPGFISGLLLAYWFGVVLRWFPVTGWVRLTEDPVGNLHHVFLPALVLTLSEIPVFTRLLRSDMIATLQQDFVLAARAKGLSPRYILFRHALRPSSFSLITLAAISFGRLLGGAVLVEQIFALPGLGSQVLGSILSKDFSMVQGITVFLAFSYVLINAAVDVGYAFLDPRVRARVAG